jgi:predicted permease
MVDDLRIALRSLRKQPGFAAVAVLTLAFGIGVNATVFSMVSAFFLQPLSVKDPHQLVMLLQRGDIIDVPYGHSFPDYLDYRAEVTAFTDLAAFMPTPVHLSARRQVPERTWVEVVSPNYFALAGVTPGLGQLLRPGEPETKAAAPTVVLAHRYWQRRFGGDPAIVGEPITLNGKSFTVIGIAPDTFTGLSWAMAVSAWVPSGAADTLLGEGAFLEHRGAHAFRVMGRLAPGKTIAEARAEVEVVASRLAAEYPAAHRNSRPLLIPENRARPDPSAAEFLPIFAAVFTAIVAMVLFIACANVANLMLARALGRQQDLVIRSALGASRFRLIRLQVVESLVLATLAGALGILLAEWAGRMLAGFSPAGDIPINQDQPWDWRVYAFTIGLSFIAGVGTALWPARQASRFNLVESLKEGSSGSGRSRHRLRNLLVVAQVSLSLVVLVSAGLFVHSLREMQRLSLGFRTDGVLMLSMDLGLQQYNDIRGQRFLDDLVARAEALPGVTSATVAAHVPLDYGMQFHDVAIEGVIPGTKDDYLTTAFNSVGPGFLETTGARLVRGRGFEAADTERSRLVGMVNETMARQLWPGEDAIGKRFRFGRDGEWIEVVGIVADGKYVMLGEEPRAYFYVPLAQRYRSPITLLVRSPASDPRALVGPLQEILRAMDPNLPVFNVRTMESHVRDSAFGLMPLRFGAALAGGQGLIALFLAVMGLYAVVSYAVTRRTREIGVRMALGANHADVLRLVMREALRLTLVGIVLGLLASVGLGLVLSRVLYGVKPVDAGILAAVTALLVLVAALACYLPARRATRLDPLVAFRAE